MTLTLIQAELLRICTQPSRSLDAQSSDDQIHELRMWGERPLDLSEQYCDLGLDLTHTFLVLILITVDGDGFAILEISNVGRRVGGRRRVVR